MTWHTQRETSPHSCIRLDYIWEPLSSELFLQANEFPGDSDGKESACNAGKLDSIPGLGRFPEEGNGYPLQYSGLENSINRGAWKAIVHGIAKSQA